jgi:hypothetical protein
MKTVHLTNMTDETAEHLQRRFSALVDVWYHEPTNELVLGTVPLDLGVPTIDDAALYDGEYSGLQTAYVFRQRDMIHIGFLD